MGGQARLGIEQTRAFCQSFARKPDSLGQVEVPATKLWGAQTQRSLQHFSIGQDLIPREMIAAYANVKRASATANHAGGRLGDQAYESISKDG